MVYCGVVRVTVRWCGQGDSALLAPGIPTENTGGKGWKGCVLLDSDQYTVHIVHSTHGTPYTQYTVHMLESTVMAHYTVHRQQSQPTAAN